MTSLPRTLYRRVNGGAALNNHLCGLLWFRSPHYFHDVEGPQKDSMEGIGSYKSGGISYTDVSDRNTGVQPGFILSFTETVEATEKFGSECGPSFVLELKDTAKFEEFIRQELIHKTDRTAIMVDWGKVKYDKVETMNRELSPSEEYCRKYFSKPKQYEQENEWRLLITFTRLTLFNDTIKIRFSNKIRCFWNYWRADISK